MWVWMSKRVSEWVRFQRREREREGGSQSAILGAPGLTDGQQQVEKRAVSISACRSVSVPGGHVTWACRVRVVCLYVGCTSCRVFAVGNPTTNSSCSSGSAAAAGSAADSASAQAPRAGELRRRVPPRVVVSTPGRARREPGPTSPHGTPRDPQNPEPSQPANQPTNLPTNRRRPHTKHTTTNQPTNIQPFPPSTLTVHPPKHSLIKKMYQNLKEKLETLLVIGEFFLPKGELESWNTGAIY